MSSTPVEPPKTSGGIPTHFIVIGLVIATILGFIWTRHHRATKKDLDTDAMINDINNKGANLRRQLREEQAAISRAQARAQMTAGAITPAKLPADFDEAKIREMLDACSFFQERVKIEVPRQVQSYGMDYNPSVRAALAEHLIEFDPPTNSVPPGTTVNVKVTPSAYSKVDVSEEPAVYHFSLGRRRVEITRTVPTSESSVSVNFTWTFDQNGAPSLAPEGDSRSGTADVRRTADGWVIQSISRTASRRSGSMTSFGCQ